MIYSKSARMQPLDEAEQVQLALYNFFKVADKLSKERGLGGLQRLDIQVVDGKFGISWVHGPRHQVVDRGSKIEDWANLPFLPKN